MASQARWTRGGQHFAFGRLDGLRTFLPLLVNFGLLEPDFFDEHSLPQTQIYVLQAVDGFGFQLELLANDFSGFLGGSAGGSVEGLGNVDLKLFGDLRSFLPTAFAERNIQDALNASLMIVIGASGPKENYLDHKMGSSFKNQADGTVRRILEAVAMWSDTTSTHGYARRLEGNTEIC